MLATLMFNMCKWPTNLVQEVVYWEFAVIYIPQRDTIKQCSIYAAGYKWGTEHVSERMGESYKRRNGAQTCAYNISESQTREIANQLYRCPVTHVSK